MHTVREVIEGDTTLWSVGYQKRTGRWRRLQDFAEFADAAALVSWLNGGLNPRVEALLSDWLSDEK